MIGYFDTELGRVQISPTIVRRVIQREVEKSRHFRFPGTKNGESINRKTLERCVCVNFVEGSVEATLILAVLYQSRIIKEARELQGKIVRALQLGTGLNVRKVSINVESVFEEQIRQPLLLESEMETVDAVNQ